MIYKSFNAHIVIRIYIDDLLITGGNQEEIEKIILKIKNRYKMKDLGPARNVLGMRILRNGDKLSLDQSRYAAEIVHEHYYEDGLMYATLMATNAVAVLENDSDKNLTTSQADFFLKPIGKLNWLCQTRFDIVFAVHKVQQFSGGAKQIHWQALLRIIGYIVGTLNYGLVWGVINDFTGEINDIESYSFDHNIECHVETSKATDLEVVTGAQSWLE
ncbi:hypothetical protein K3495_g412 [Podosphaera aphanis]|nr:hypothetical protein K3495_g412 [Podosphaera aphanis]